MAQVTLSAAGVIERAGLALTNVNPVPQRAAAAEKHLIGKKPDAALLNEAGRLAAEASSPNADRRGQVDYKKEMARVLAARALQIAVDRAGGR